MSDDIRKVVALLSPTKPTSEPVLRAALERGGMREHQAESAVNKAVAANKIRWVAFEGWCAGGRPA